MIRIVAALALSIAISQSSIGASVRCLTEPVDDVKMSSIVEGVVFAIHHGEGSIVGKGEVILELESRSEQLDVDRRSVLVDTLKSKLDTSEKLLASTSAISVEEVDEARSDYRIATLELELAEDALDKKKLKAPFSGMVTDMPIEVGEYCEPPQILLRMVDTRQFYCVANINPVTAARLKKQDRVSFKTEGKSDMEPLEGKIVFISPVVDSASGLLRIKALFNNTGNSVRPGEGGYLELVVN
ncbi:MAG: membrane fusion protein (multidrug efflux system) [Candidatus Pelagisphaera sp.]|jgi:membrane fusion protein (multidrug efflux system)